MDITVGQYQELYAIQKSDIDELEKITESVAVLSGMTARQLDELPVIEFNKLANNVMAILSKELPPSDPKKIIQCEDSEYGISYEPAKLNRGQYVTVLHFMKGDLIANCHLILASLSYNVRTKKHEAENHAAIAEDIKSAKFMDVYSACVFFCELFRNSISSLQGFLEKEMKRTGKQKEVKKAITDLIKIMDGYIPQSKLQTSRA